MNHATERNAPGQRRAHCAVVRSSPLANVRFYTNHRVRRPIQLIVVDGMNCIAFMPFALWIYDRVATNAIGAMNAEFIMDTSDAARRAHLRDAQLVGCADRRIGGMRARKKRIVVTRLSEQTAGIPLNALIGFHAPKGPADVNNKNATTRLRNEGRSSGASA